MPWNVGCTRVYLQNDGAVEQVILWMGYIELGEVEDAEGPLRGMNSAIYPPRLTRLHHQVAATNSSSHTQPKAIQQIVALLPKPVHFQHSYQLQSTRNMAENTMMSKGFGFDGVNHGHPPLMVPQSSPYATFSSPMSVVDPELQSQTDWRPLESNLTMVLPRIGRSVDAATQTDLNGVFLRMPNNPPSAASTTADCAIQTGLIDLSFIATTILDHRSHSNTGSSGVEHTEANRTRCSMCSKSKAAVEFCGKKTCNSCRVRAGDYRKRNGVSKGGSGKRVLKGNN
ncbi:hypothetical protein BDD12DRAFT_940065 [Trichophaea hybrida]|nr:hypothetical protein BDD12DRAFT_940065 [Trichophaea hybrida]